MEEINMKLLLEKAAVFFFVIQNYGITVIVKVRAIKR